MGRHVWGALAANATAPCLLLQLAYVKSAFLEPMKIFGSDQADMLTVIAVFLPMGWTVMAITILPLSLLFALLAHSAGWRSRWVYIGAGAIFGLGSCTWLLPWIFGAPQDGLSLPLSYSLIGAACGWIHWRTAIGRTPGNSRAIDAA